MCNVVFTFDSAESSILSPMVCIVTETAVIFVLLIYC